MLDMPSANGGERVYSRPTAARRGMAVRKRVSGETWQLLRQILGQGKWAVFPPDDITGRSGNLKAWFVNSDVLRGLAEVGRGQLPRPMRRIIMAS